jgi:lipopolysaccharide/colanic/teichoic acid biosynthesis glycosyltransferase
MARGEYVQIFIIASPLFIWASSRAPTLEQSQSPALRRSTGARWICEERSLSRLRRRTQSAQRGATSLGIGELARYLAEQSTTECPATALAWYLGIKRILDVLVSSVALLLSLPLLLFIAIAIKLDSPGPVVFRQKRVRGSQAPNSPHPEQSVFDFFKFRSMYVNCDHEVHRRYVTQYMNGHAGANNGSAHKPIYKMKNDPRVTRVGRFLRRTSLDELPQLLNVLMGDMSLVGPRPALPYEVEQYDLRHRQRLIPQAGLTGLWQVSGRTTLSFEEMINLDVEYAHKRSLGLDLSILLRTIPTILSRHGAW